MFRENNAMAAIEPTKFRYVQFNDPCACRISQFSSGIVNALFFG